MLADAKVDVAPLTVLIGKVSSTLNVVESRTEEIRATADQQGHSLGDRLKNDASGLAGGNRLVWLERRDE